MRVWSWVGGGSCVPATLCTGVAAPLGRPGRGQAGGWMCRAVLQSKARVSRQVRSAPDNLLALPPQLLFLFQFTRTLSHGFLSPLGNLSMPPGVCVIRRGAGCPAHCPCCLLPVALGICWTCVNFYVCVCASVCARPAVGSWCLPPGPGIL